MTRTNDRLDEVIRVEAVADWCSVKGSAKTIATAAAHRQPDRWKTSDDESRLLLAAGAAPVEGSIRDAIAAVRRGVSMSAWMAMALAAACGVAAVAAALPAERSTPTNVFWMIAGVMGVQSALLVAWIAAMIVLPRARTPGLAGRLVALAGRAIAARQARRDRTVHDDASVASRRTIERVGRLETRTAMARWGFGLLSNGMWAVFNLAGLSTALLLLGSRQYEFAWESTILGPETYVVLIDSIAMLPRQFGVPTPSAEAIAASRFDPTDPSAFPPQSDELRAAWSGLLLGAIAVYGLAPRLLLTALCLVRRRRAASGVAIDTSDPAVAGLIEAVRAVEIKDPPTADVELESERPADPDTASAQRPVAAPAIVGIEISTPACGWPPSLSREILDLGIVASGEERRVVRDMLGASPTRPARLVAVCESITTPDRGVAAAIRGLAESAASPTLLVVSGGDRLRRRSSAADTTRRLADWRSLAESLRIDLVEVDLDHLTATSRSRLIDAIFAPTGPDSTDIGSASGSDRLFPSQLLAEAFRAIVAASRGWHDGDGSLRAPTPAEESDLHRRVVRIFEGDGEVARWPFPPLSPADPAGSIRRAASRIESVLPNSLRLRPKWLAAGAAAGALGCVAAATLVTPLAISALPIWSGIGGTIAGLLSARSTARDDDRSGTSPTVDLGPAVATAVLQVVLLAHQGMGEDAIGHALEVAIEPEEPGTLSDIDSLQRWCRTVEGRLAASSGDRFA